MASRYPSTRYVPLDDRAEPIHTPVILPLDAREDRVTAIARRISRIMAKVELATFAFTAVYMGTHVYLGLSRAGLLPW